MLALLAACGGDSATAPDAGGEVAAISVDPLTARGSATAVSPNAVELAPGASVRLVALDAGGKPVRATWTSSAAAVATIASDGTVTGVAAGDATVTASTRSGSATASVRVVAPAAPAPPPAAGCDALAHTRLVAVSTAAQLAAALAGAQPGDLIRLADGTYAGRFTASASGTADRPVTVCGTRRAVLDGGSHATGTGFLVQGSGWVLDGFTVTRSLSGIVLRGATRTVVRGVQVHATGHEGVHFGWNSTDNVLENSLIHDTGLLVAEYGEGVYVGSYNGHWCARTGCQPDRSDRNRVQNNVIGPNVRAEHVDVKEGTTGGFIQGNTFHGTGMVQSQDWVDAWVEVKGNGWLISGNRGSSSPRDGFQVFRQIEGWGNDNVFRDNTADVRAAGYGFRVGAGTSGNRVECVNTVQNAAAGFANVSCR